MEMGLPWADVRFFLTQQHLQLTLSKTLQRQRPARAAVVPPRDGIFVSIWAHARKGSRGEPKGRSTMYRADLDQGASGDGAILIIILCKLSSSFNDRISSNSRRSLPTHKSHQHPFTKASRRYPKLTTNPEFTSFTSVLPSKHPEGTCAHLWRTTPVHITTTRVGPPSSTVITTAGSPYPPSLGILDGSPLARIAFQPDNCRRSPRRISQPKHNLPPINHLQRSKEYDSEKFCAQLFNCSQHYIRRNSQIPDYIPPPP
jgi:hypothetical protein